jgi:hypothetical protein
MSGAPSVLGSARALAIALGTALALVGTLEGQVCRPGSGSNEAKTLALLSVPIAFGPATAPERNPRLEVGLEGT